MRGTMKRTVSALALGVLLSALTAVPTLADSVSLKSTTEIKTGVSDLFSTAVVNDETVPVWEINKEDKLVLEGLDLPFATYRELSVGMLFPQPDGEYLLELKADGSRNYLKGAGNYLVIDTDLNAGEEYDIFNLLRFNGELGGHTVEECLFFLMFHYDKDGVETVWTGDLFLKFVDAKTLAHQRAAMENKLQPGHKEVPQWKSDEKGWWLAYSDGSYMVNEWYQSPESGLRYYMGADGYMLTDTVTPDGFYVNGDGVRVEEPDQETEQETGQETPQEE